MLNTLKNDNIYLPPNLSMVVDSLRDIGYSLKTAVADILDNSISANAKNISIFSLPSRNILAIIDNGIGMNFDELKEAMRLGTKHKPAYSNIDLGRFGLGLKTASFSQCRKLTVISKKENQTNCFSWDLDIISKENKWILQQIQTDEYINELNSLNKQILIMFNQYTSGTIVLWQKIDRYSNEDDFESNLSLLKDYISLIYHKFLSSSGYKGHKITISCNGKQLKYFNPFSPQDKNVAMATQNSNAETKTLSDKNTITITRHILPPLNRLSVGEYKTLGMQEGFTRNQGFYLYRNGRLLVYGTWFGLAKMNDSSNLVRIELDIDNQQDKLWNIDIKKSIAYPVKEIKKILEHYISIPIEKSIKVHKSIGKNISIENSPYWIETHMNQFTSFGINYKHPRFLNLINSMNPEQRIYLRTYLAELMNTLPLERIHYQMSAGPHEVCVNEFDIEFLKSDIIELKSRGNTKEKALELLLMDDFYIGREKEIKELINNIYMQ